jgi:hypothetical protein
MISLLVEFLVLRVMIRYHNMIPLSSLSLLIDTPHQLFVCMECMIQLMILALWLALCHPRGRVGSKDSSFGRDMVRKLHVLPLHYSWQETMQGESLA